jgi:hypothetical protein
MTAPIVGDITLVYSPPPSLPEVYTIAASPQLRGKCEGMTLTAHKKRPLRGAEMCRNCMFVGFEVLTLLVIMSAIFWDITPCNPLKFNRRFGKALLFAGFSPRIFFDTENGGDMFLWNAG